MHLTPENLQILNTVDSTNNYAMALAQKGLLAGPRAVFAMEQTGGRGRRGRQWISNPGENIILSVAAPMQWLPVSRQFELSVAAALSCHDLFRRHFLGNLYIKWPNDLFINDRKSGGILIENVIKGAIWQSAVVGIGLNVNQERFDAGIQKATSLRNETGKFHDVLGLARSLYSILISRMEEVKDGQFERLLLQYNERLYGRGQWVQLKTQDALYETKIREVSPDGRLVTSDTRERSFGFDEVEFKGLL